MIVAPEEKKKGPGTAFTCLNSLLLIFFLWTTASSGFFRILPRIDSQSAAGALLSMVIILFFIILASYLNSVYTRFAEPFFRKNNPIRITALILLTLITLGCYLTVRTTGIKNDLIYGLATSNLIVIASILGNWMTFPVKRPVEIIPLCFVAGLADIFSVTSGPTKVMATDLVGYYSRGMSGPPPFVDFLLVKIPLPDSGSLAPLFGVSDWVIVVFLGAVSLKFNIKEEIPGLFFKKAAEKSRPQYLSVSAAGLFMAILAARMSGIFLPALPVIIIFFLGYSLARYPVMRGLTKTELRQMFLAAGVMISLFLFFKI